MVVKIIDWLEIDGRNPDDPGVVVALITEKIAHEIAPLLTEGQIEMVGDVDYHETRRMDPWDVIRVDLFYNQKRWYSFSRNFFNGYLNEVGIWVFEIPSKLGKPIREKVEISFRKYQAELVAHKIKYILK